MSNASEDLPEPDRPVMTINSSRGRSMEIFLRLCSRAPRTESILAWGSREGREAIGLTGALMGTLEQIIWGADGSKVASGCANLVVGYCMEVARGRFKYASALWHVE